MESVKVGSATEVTTTVTLPSFNAVKEKEELAALGVRVANSLMELSWKAALKLRSVNTEDCTLTA